ncbi:MAG TPA: indole-3-glycerol phosphate synthase TrpC [Pyrinomonadaceae bacterium]|jgi:indole-3-glycerol phosphate synthase|nr:indole-3-glycerol phosphate synthase TrpC [Pyrinomonadaceae bacterium]
MDFLTEIMSLKRARLEESKKARAIEDLRAQADDVRRDSRLHALRTALNNRKRINVIAEFKRASPSKGVIRADVEPSQIARSYEAGGAAAISVLTEEDRFQGSLDDLRAVRATVKLPVLRKDFIFDEYQLYESAAAGADALLLIVAALDDERLARLRRITEDELRMDALVEVHTKDEMRRAVNAGATLLGVNNRDLRSFKVSLEVSVQLAQDAPRGSLLISESGLSSRDDLRRLHALGYQGFLMGETLMRSAQPDAALRILLDERQNSESSSQNPV